MITEKMVVAEVLYRWPQTEVAFLRNGIRHPGDHAAQTLGDAAREEHVGVDRLLHALNCAIDEPRASSVRSGFSKIGPETTVEAVVYTYGGNDILHAFGIQPCETLKLKLRDAAAYAGADLEALLARLREGGR